MHRRCPEGTGNGEGGRTVRTASPYRRFVVPRLSLVLLLCAFAAPAFAQETTIPRNDEAELVFEQAIEAFEAGDYGMAYRRFRLVYERYELNRRTTAALLMAGKAAYREGDYDQAVRVLTALVESFPTTTYADEARETIGFARQAIDEGVQEPHVFSLGVVLPLRGADVALTQALFNGLYLAVEAHNEARPDRPARMIFRDSQGTATGGAEAVTALAREGVDAIIGPLYSDEAGAAGRAAEAANVVLLAPLATDEAVSEGRAFVFQANPTFTMRGRLMARFAIDNLRLSRFGIAAQLGEYGERLAEGFQEEALARGADVRFFSLLEPPATWSELLGNVALRDIEALYLPVTGGRAAQSIREVLADLQETGARPRVLGNAEWQGLNAQTQADLFSTTFTNDFYVGAASEAVAAFDRRYAERSGSAPDGQLRRLAYTGYDVTRFLLSALADAPAGGFPDALRAAPPYEGLGLRLDFEEGNVNEAIYFMRYRAGSVELLR